jgi:hypothetical protein
MNPMLSPMDGNHRERVAEEFWKQIETEAAKFEVTVDYYLAEFYVSN